LILENITDRLSRNVGKKLPVYAVQNPTRAKISGRQVIRTVKCADELLLLAKVETLLQGMIDRLIEIRRHYGMEMNVE
jgi:hypothetical protein